MTLHIAFDNSYARLPDRFFAAQAPTPVRAPRLIALNDGLARELGLDPDALRSPDGIAMLAGNLVPQGATPLAQAYAGHQFGGWVPQLGDGRAVLLGEVIDTAGQRRDIHLKGAGRTPFSRGGDGRAWLGPVLREYLVSEAMHAMGIPTTRALAAVATGEQVFRETALPGAVLTRVAASHIRVGTFQYFAARGDIDALQHLTDHAIARHYPTAEGALGLLRAVMGAQARLVARWMGVGFIHGVMNTDNTSISGETIDYGPCAFMDQYDAGTVFSSIDRGGRYAYNRQADIMLWNLAQLASALLPLMGPDRNAAIAAATAVLDDFPDLFKREWLAVFGAKIGIAQPVDQDTDLIQRLLDIIAANGLDFTNSFRSLSDEHDISGLRAAAGFDAWQADWQARVSGSTTAAAQMQSVNPAYIPRNHRIEAAIADAVNGDFTTFEHLFRIVTQPYALQPENAGYMSPPTPEQQVTKTYCGT